MDMRSRRTRNNVPLIRDSAVRQEACPEKAVVVVFSNFPMVAPKRAAS